MTDPSPSGIRVTPSIALRLRRALGRDALCAFSTATLEAILNVAVDEGALPHLGPIYSPIRCSQCLQVEGSRHIGSCYRQGIVSIAADARFTGKAADHIREQAKEIERLKRLLGTASKNETNE